MATRPPIDQSPYGAILDEIRHTSEAIRVELADLRRVGEERHAEAIERHVAHAERLASLEARFGAQVARTSDGAALGGDVTGRHERPEQQHVEPVRLDLWPPRAVGVGPVIALVVALVAAAAFIAWAIATGIGAKAADHYLATPPATTSPAAPARKE